MVYQKFYGHHEVFWGQRCVSCQAFDGMNVDMKTPAREQVHKLDAAAYFKVLAELLKTNPPAAADGPIVAKLAKIGIVGKKMQA
jgi:hypothetical protein